MGAVDLAARAVGSADALLVGAGAGMGVDSGLPDFRGNEGFWKAYPPMRKLGLSFVDMASPEWFDQDPTLAWGFYGHRLHLYRETEPHRGFRILRAWGRRTRLGTFVFTSNVDGQFQTAGFDEDLVVECHGSLHHLQCSRPCSDLIWSAEGVDVNVDPSTFRASPPLPRCPRCGAVARPNALLFGDLCWISDRSDEQTARFRSWIDRARDAKLVVVELGAGGAIPTVRWTCERVAASLAAPLVRINPREPHGPPETISIPAGALAALEEMSAAIGE